MSPILQRSTGEIGMKVGNGVAAVFNPPEPLSM
jgi:hypothetical protein